MFTIPLTVDLYGINPPAKTAICLPGLIAVTFHKAELLDELYVTKNTAYSKHSIERTMSLPLLKNALASMETENPTYKVKRKALSAAFLKGKI